MNLVSVESFLPAALVATVDDETPCEMEGLRGVK